MSHEQVGRRPQYESIAQAYARHAAVNPWNAAYDRPAVLALAGEVDGLRVLDAGCGPGLYAEELVARGADVVAVDQSPAMVELARDRAPSAEVRVHDLADDPVWLADHSVDLVVCPLVWHYLDDRVATLRWFRRLVAPGGAVVISTHHPASDWVRLGGSYFTEAVVEEHWSAGGWDMRFWRLPLTTLTEEFAGAGFHIERLVEPRPDPDLARTNPGVHERLSTSPGFVLFRLRAGCSPERSGSHGT
ncbi:class I SAM-dependent methyltransferase [Thalassiella azotivora]